MNKPNYITNVPVADQADRPANSEARETSPDKSASRGNSVVTPITRRKAEETQRDELDKLLADPEPWGSEVTTAELMEEIVSLFRRHVVLPEDELLVVALWTLFTWVHDVFRISPILTLSSPEKGCGKTTLLSILNALVRRPLPASNVTTATLFRIIEKRRPTLLIDEADTFLRGNNELRGILNSGHTKDAAFVLRCVGENYEPKRFSTWGAKAVAFIGDILHATSKDRTITIRMQRKLLGDTVQPLRLDRMDEFKPITRHCMRWAKDNFDSLREAEPEVPQGISDRAADNWRPLLAIADLASLEWSKRARAAMTKLVSENETTDVGTMLLLDINDVFGDKDKITSADLSQALAQMEHRPWSEWKDGKPITPPQIARLLKPYDIKPRNVRMALRIVKGYERNQFEEVFTRYLPKHLKG